LIHFSEYNCFEILEENIDLVVGYVHALNGNLDLAKSYFLRSIHSILKSQPLNVQEFWTLIAHLMELPRFYRLNGDFKASIECIRNVIELWKKWSQGQQILKFLLSLLSVFHLSQFLLLLCFALFCFVCLFILLFFIYMIF
jgi:hypothetical protein